MADFKWAGMSCSGLCIGQHKACCRGCTQQRRALWGGETKTRAHLNTQGCCPPSAPRSPASAAAQSQLGRVLPRVLTALDRMTCRPVQPHPTQPPAGQSSAVHTPETLQAPVYHSLAWQMCFAGAESRGTTVYTVPCTLRGSFEIKTIGVSTRTHV